MQVLQLLANKAGLPAAELTAASKELGNLGIPDGIPATSVEGLLYPATYDLDPGVTAMTALQLMVTKFGAEFSALDVPARAKAMNLTPYQALIIASISEGEAKFDADRAKVVRVILNRLAAHRPLQIDATSVYAAKLAGRDPKTVIFSKINSPYNSYLHAGLPPTPIGNPGEQSISAALNPPSADWMYYVNVDAAGHLGFFTNEADFLRAAEKCRVEGWGCG
jgi:UPF0755 protein